MLICVTILREDKNIKKTINILLVIISIFLLIIASAYFVFQSKVVQTMIINAVTRNISNSTGADVSIGKVKFTLFNKIVFDDVFISDQNKDTLLFADNFSLKIDSLSIKRNKLILNSVNVSHPKINIEKIDSFNYNFSFLFSPKSEANNKWIISINKIEFEKGKIFYNDDSLPHEINRFLKFNNFNMTLDRIIFNSLNDFSGALTNLNLSSLNGFKLNTFKSFFQLSDSVLLLKDISGKSDFSFLELDSIKLGFQSAFVNDDFSEMFLDMNLNRLFVSFRDVNFFYPEFKSEGLDISLSGSLSGKINELKGKDIEVTLGDVTNINGDFYINGLPNFDDTYIFLNIDESYANLNELRNQEFPGIGDDLKSKIPKFLDKIGVFTYTGNFTGFQNDFVAYGTIDTDMGSLRSDISFKPHENKVLKVEGHLKTYSLDVGSILDVKNIGKLTLSGNVDGTLRGSKFDLVFDGLIDSIDLNDYNFQRVVLNGNLKNKLFDGTFTVNDPNLYLKYSGRLDLSQQLPVFEFIAEVNDANLKKLNLSDDTLSMVSFGLDANFIGNNIDNLKGLIKIKDLRYRNFRDSLNLSDAVINNVYSGDTSYLSVQSDWIDGNLIGKYQFIDILTSFTNYYRYYLPSTYEAKTVEIEDQNDFKFQFTVKETNQFCRVFSPFLSFKPPFNVFGLYKPNDKKAFIETQIPSVSFAKQKMENVRIKVDGNSKSLDCILKSDKLFISESINVFNLSVESSSKNDNILANIFWNNFAEDTYSGSIKSAINFIKTESPYPEVLINVEPSKIYLSDSLWMIDRTTVKIDSSSFKFDDFSIHSNSQSVIVDGTVSEDKESTATAEIHNLDLNLIGSLIGNNGMKGTINGSAKLKDAFEKFILGLDVKVDGFALSDNNFGDAIIKCEWNNVSEKLATNISLTDKNQKIIDGSGYIDIFNKEIDLDLVLDNSPTTLLEVLLPFLFYNVQGNVSGKVKMNGRLSDMDFNGSLKPVTQVGLGINAIKTTYFFSDPVLFHGDSLVFNNITLTDEFGNTGNLIGSLTHKNFVDDLGYDILVKTDKICGMNTTSFDRERFYGTAFGKGTFHIFGKGSDVTLKGDLVTEKGTSINIPIGGTSKAEQYDFVKFSSGVKTIKKDEIVYVPKTTGLKMNFDVEVTPDAKVQIIFNSQIGDVLKAEGNGNIQVRMDKNFNLELYGNYEIEKGDYLFTLQNVINKRFSIEKGGSIKWMGNPYDALVDVKAVYKVKTSLHDLFMGSSTEVDMVRRLPVDCIIYLTENLSHPTIDFKIELPTAEDRIKEEVDQLIVSKEDVNKQIISLLMLGRFYTPDFFAGKPGTNTGVELMGATASELLSNQLTNWMSQILEDWDFGINYRPGNEISNDQVELALSTQILNDRITIGGNIANNTNPTVNNSGEIVGDFDLNIKLTDNGKLQFKAYNHSNDNLINDTSPYTQGIGFTYREEFNSLNELLKMYRDAIFNKKKKPKNIDEVKNDQ